MRAVFDANIWVSAALNRRGLPARAVAAFWDGRVTLVTSETLLEELLDVLTRPRILRKTGLSADQMAAYVAAIREKALLVPVTGEVRLCRDPDDDAVIETALCGQADVLVSRDEDLTRAPEVIAPLEKAGVRVLTVYRFLQEIGEIDEEA